MKPAAPMRALLFVLLLVGVPALAQDWPVRAVSLNGIEMAYRDVGAGEPLVLLHGFGSCAEESWAPFVDTLAAHYRLIVPDLRGHGHSTNPAGTFTHRQSAADVLALLDTLGIERRSTSRPTTSPTHGGSSQESGLRPCPRVCHVSGSFGAHQPPKPCTS